MKGILYTFTILFFTLYSFALADIQPREYPTIVLTFDDGPKPPVLLKLLPLLKKYDIPATFFVIGAVTIPHKDLLMKMHKQGHEIENHSYGHPKLTDVFKKKGEEGIRAEIKKTEQIIKEATGRKPIFFRPPFWLFSPKIQSIIHDAGYTIMKLGNPDINTLDYEDVAKHHSSDMLITRVKQIVQKREKKGIYTHIFVFHEHYITVDALSILIPYFKKRGYEFRRLDETYHQSN